jgi:hypothetical protein
MVLQESVMDFYGEGLKTILMAFMILQFSTPQILMQRLYAVWTWWNFVYVALKSPMSINFTLSDLWHAVNYVALKKYPQVYVLDYYVPIRKYKN